MVIIAKSDGRLIMAMIQIHAMIVSCHALKNENGMIMKDTQIVMPTLYDNSTSCDNDVITTTIQIMT